MRPAKTCLHCGNPIQGRPDKKFCDDHCRSYFNNQYNHDISSTMRNINYILRKKRRLMAALLKDTQKLKVSKDSLLASGFDFRYFTHLYQNSRNQEFKICYDYGYFTDPSGNATIVSFPDNPATLSLKDIRRLVNTPERTPSQNISGQPDHMISIEEESNNSSA